MFTEWMLMSYSSQKTNPFTVIADRSCKKKAPPVHFTLCTSVSRGYRCQSRCLSVTTIILSEQHPLKILTL
ncbi:unnamed protein product [Wuchereria bancrofti]|uniref:Uncharacterized protein n=1 Tax=Wuchereria bancrofti TaxID=6293 RepID=A0A3P7DDK8_WUCBA|nr:unnamed protein product [Wuchereria bancrofti]